MKQFRGTAQIVRFNWPQYVTGSIAIAIGLSLVLSSSVPLIVRVLAAVGTTMAGWWLLASLVASWWIYDLSSLTQWNWLIDHAGPTAPRGSLVNLHSGFDNTTLLLRALFPSATLKVLDIYDPQTMTEPSIHRAQRCFPRLPETLSARPEELPLSSGAIDATFLLLAIHELRAPADREACFEELYRSLRPGGRVVLAEHARDFANFLAFGPGFWHFLPSHEWIRLAERSKFSVVAQGRTTPFVRYLVLEKPT